ncbi:hypothetical protein L596_026154 [Steinernema carpocapsae]|uniref:ShKT domain-containing protein n=1 Tax=Steinernema carpocapsae TaxID=34508 RepID=A0A4U5M0J0_STECR|nr:hypothetical protein L596_026154 [Steinernema carpocapsae]
MQVLVLLLPIFLILVNGQLGDRCQDNKCPDGFNCNLNSGLCERCEDQLSKCAWNTRFCSVAAYKGYFEEQCPYTCGYCKLAPGQKPCVDRFIGPKGKCSVSEGRIL